MPRDPHLPPLPSGGGPNLVPGWWAGRLAKRKQQQAQTARAAQQYGATNSEAYSRRQPLSKTTQPKLALEILNGPIAGRCLPWRGGQLQLGSSTAGLATTRRSPAGMRGCTRP